MSDDLANEAIFNRAELTFEAARDIQAGERQSVKARSALDILTGDRHNEQVAGKAAEIDHDSRANFVAAQIRKRDGKQDDIIV